MKLSGPSDVDCLAWPAFYRFAAGCFFFLFLVLHTGSGLAKEKGLSSAKQSAEPAVCSIDLTEEQFQSEMKKYLGIPYQFGGSNRKGTDCSGLIRQMYRNLFGLDLPHNAAAQSRSPHLEDISKDALKVGDLIFFGSSEERIDHMGAYLGDGEFIHASRKYGATTVSHLDKPYWRKRFVCSKHVKGLDITGTEWSQGIDAVVAQEADERDRIGSEAIEWSLFAMEGDSGAGVLNEVMLAPFFDLTVETFTLWSAQESSESALFDPDTGPEYYRGLSDLQSRHGVRLSKEFALLPWLQLAPFWSYVRQQDDNITQNKEEQSLGLSAQIGHAALPWSISLAARPFSGKQQAGHPSLWERDWRQLELFFGCRYHISESWKFSVYGSGNTGSSQDVLLEGPDERTGSPAVEDVTVLIDFTF